MNFADVLVAEIYPGGPLFLDIVQVQAIIA